MSPKLLYHHVIFISYFTNSCSALILSTCYWVKVNDISTCWWIISVSWLLWQLYSHFVDGLRPAFYLSFIEIQYTTNIIILNLIKSCCLCKKKLNLLHNYVPGCPPIVIDCSLHFNAKLNLSQPELSQYFLKTMPTQFSLFIMLKCKNIN